MSFCFDVLFLLAAAQARCRCRGWASFGDGYVLGRGAYAPQPACNHFKLLNVPFPIFFQPSLFSFVPLFIFNESGLCFCLPPAAGPLRFSQDALEQSAWGAGHPAGHSRSRGSPRSLSLAIRDAILVPCSGVMLTQPRAWKISRRSLLSRQRLHLSQSLPCSGRTSGTTEAGIQGGCGISILRDIFYFQPSGICVGVRSVASRRLNSTWHLSKRHHLPGDLSPRFLVPVVPTRRVTSHARCTLINPSAGQERLLPTKRTHGCWERLGFPPSPALRILGHVLAHPPASQGWTRDPTLPGAALKWGGGRGSLALAPQCQAPGNTARRGMGRRRKASWKMKRH